MINEIINTSKNQNHIEKTASKDPTLVVNEIFYSIQGEASFSGYPCIFIRLTGCHLRCNWCDTSYSFYEGTKNTFHEIFDQIKKFPSHLVEITGGEPLLQQNVFLFFQFLYERKYKILLETSGAKSISEVPEFVHIVMDIKAPGSGEVEKNDHQNLYSIKPSDDLKIVVSSGMDLKWAEEICIQHNVHSILNKPPILQPVFENISLKEIGEFIKYSSVAFRLGMQMHKYIYPAHARGV